ncbi:MAG TPA: sigma-54 dependent transcriptional regulator [Terracidiphilus sp.]|jgi:DNA-binding NtrC family response regulator|nr:sigma-54 dependent transcriptional regulator [Terracidiphilus sp.]
MATPAVQIARLEDRIPIDVFVVSSNARLREDLQGKLSPPRWNVVQASGGADALRLLQRQGVEDGVILLDPMLPDLDANEFHGIVRDRYPNTQVMMLNSHTGQLLVGGASPTPVSRKLADVVNQNGSLRAAPIPMIVNDNKRLQTEGKAKLRSMIGNSEAMMRIFTLTRMVAARDTTVLVTGESGTGKDLIAQEIHLISPRRNQPFVVVNCSAIPEALLEAELFGYTKGSFTGAVQARIGRIHAAHGGTLFLDEIGDMPLSLQSKILRFLEQGEVQRLGGNENLKVDVRVVAATNAELKKRVAEGQFREDLYYRLAVFPIHLPPLRDRMSDVEELALAFTSKFHPGASLSREALNVLEQHAWPGNVRELRNAIERATILVGGGNDINPEHIVL